ncbi:methyltransferase domain protein [Rhizoctonia solani AG-3 Rhs1AP]|uniref:RNA methyltransferase n=1 Tax=Rhizoctonia solani AG-3 Rhs1AP TaxID=1086054 RepID=X8JAW0_9AGAM|nr:methyltransferase domain protein [Rhizoctonia solani AG-3 Rhs1AP]
MYISYYTKRGNQTSDPRLKVLSPDLFKGKRVLDIGCNEGWVTCEIASRYEAKEVVGVDIDSELVSRAWRHRRDVWSLQTPKASSRAAPADTLEEEYSVQGKNDVYFPECFPSLFGPVPIPPQHLAFPNNVSFHQSDWANQGCAADKLGYNVVIAFSVSKWIHVHGGDEGIEQFFSRVRDVLAACATGRFFGRFVTYIIHLICIIETSPSIFVLEAQPWSGYHSAVRKANLQIPKEARE